MATRNTDLSFDACVGAWYPDPTFRRRRWALRTRISPVWYGGAVYALSLGAVLCAALADWDFASGVLCGLAAYMGARGR